MTKSFGLDARSALEALERCVGRFKRDETDGDLARDCALKAWHLCDHAFSALGPESKSTKLQEFQKDVKSECRELAWLQDICNESKHGKITRYPPTIKSARLHHGEFDHKEFDPREFNTDRLEVTLPGGETVAFSDIADRAVDYWASFFRDNGIA